MPDFRLTGGPDVYRRRCRRSLDATKEAAAFYRGYGPAGADPIAKLAATSRSQPFEDLAFTAAGDRVVVEGRNRSTAVTTGRPYEHQWVMVFTISGGEIARFRHYYDSADITHALG